MKLKVMSADASKLAAKALRAQKRALGVLAENALADCSEYVPYDKGRLQASGKTQVKDGEAYVMWGTNADTARYARVQYYGNFNHSTLGNSLHSPRACSHWFEAARRERLSAWSDMYKEVFNQGVSK